MVPEYKCRRCALTFDGPSVMQDVLVEDALRYAEGGNHVKGEYIRLTAQHRNCIKTTYFINDSVSRVPGIGIGDLIGGRDK